MWDRASALSVLLLCLCLPAQAAAQTAKRIVSLVPSATEALFAMGAGARIVGVGSFDAFPREVERLPRVGALLDPDVEKILSLKPDLMVCYASQTELQTQLARAGIRIFAYKHGSLADAISAIRQLGHAAGVPREGDALASRLEQALGAIRARATGPRPKVMLVIGREPGSLRTINVSGGYGFLHDLVEVAGGINVFGEVTKESLNVSTETVLARAPDVIVELKYSKEATPADRERDVREWNVLAAVPAVRTHRVHVLYGGELVVPGPRMTNAAEALAQAIRQ
jgi:ABC-type Fe3+-hydroxamate transport system substrate-binding protein